MKPMRPDGGARRLRAHADRARNGVRQHEAGRKTDDHLRRHDDRRAARGSISIQPMPTSEPNTGDGDAAADHEVDAVPRGPASGREVAAIR